jgi:hypothetical protein
MIRMYQPVAPVINRHPPCAPLRLLYGEHYAPPMGPSY